MGGIRRLAALAVRGPDAAFIRDDLEALYQRDRAAGASAVRAHLRYARRMVASAAAVARGRAGWPRLPGISWLDFRLAGRLLVRHPALTVVAGLALAIGIPLALAPMQLANAINAPLPFEDRDRIVGVEYVVAPRMFDRQPTLHDFERWRGETSQFATLAAALPQRANVASDRGPLEARTGVTITATAFDVPRVAPLIGRTLRPADEAETAAPVVLIGHDLWQSHFGGAADAVGSAMQIAGTTRAVVGVMPAGFEFPYRGDFWLPLQARARDYPIGRGPLLAVFGRLRDGVSREQAQAELIAVSQRIAAEHPDTYADLTPVVTEYAYVVTGLTPTVDRVWPAYVISVLLLGVACANVGTLMLARTAGRTNEIAIRAALGAGRARIVTQLFLETLVLSSVSAAAGLLAAEIALRRLDVVRRLESSLPPWFSLNVTPRTMAIAASLAVFSAVIAGLLPALRVTGKRSYGILQRSGAGSGAVRFGLVASVLIVAEVGVAVAGLSGVASVAKGAFRNPSLGAALAAHEFLATELVLPPDLSRPAAGDRSMTRFVARVAAIQTDAALRLETEPGVRATTFASHLPGLNHPRLLVEVDDATVMFRAPQGHIVRYARVAPNFFAALGQPILVGRDFAPGDLTGATRPVLVNRSFVAEVLGGQSPLGRRIRTPAASDAPAGPWQEIVGVVNDLGMNVVDPTQSAGVYYPFAPGQVHPVRMVTRVAGDPAAFIARIRAVVNHIEPTMVLAAPAQLDRVFSETLWEARFKAFAFMAIASVALVLSAAGLYALMAFSVAQRTREIAIRTALGARPSRIVRGVIGRATVQLGAGIALGVAAAVALIPAILDDTTMAVNWRAMVAAVSAAMVLIGLLACVGPTRRALRIRPVQALKEL